MPDRQLWPDPLKILSRQASVALIGSGFGAEQAGMVQHCGVEADVWLARCEHTAILLFIIRPNELAFLVTVEQFPGRCEGRQVRIVRPDDCLQEVLQVAALGITCQLGRIVQPRDDSKRHAPDNLGTPYNGPRLSDFVR